MVQLIQFDPLLIFCPARSRAAAKPSQIIV